MSKSVSTTTKTEARRLAQAKEISSAPEAQATPIDDSIRGMYAYLRSISQRTPPTSASEYYERAYEYLDTMINLGCTPAKPGLAMALGYGDWSSVDRMMDGRRDSVLGDNTDCNGDKRGDNGRESPRDQVVAVIKNALLVAEQVTHELTIRGRIGAMFLLKSQFGYREATGQTGQALPSLNLQINFGNQSPQVGGNSGGNLQITIPSSLMESTS